MIAFARVCVHSTVLEVHQIQQLNVLVTWVTICTLMEAYGNVWVRDQSRIDFK